MRTLLLVALVGAALLAAAPVASASHSGPCTHEWFEIVYYGVATIKSGGLNFIVAGAKYCASNTGGSPALLP